MDVIEKAQARFPSWKCILKPRLQSQLHFVVLMSKVIQNLTSDEIVLASNKFIEQLLSFRINFELILTLRQL